jgi:hypothetical protein
VSARGLINALGGFDAKLVRTSDGGFDVRVQLEGNDRETVQVLNALSTYVNERSTRARVTLNGREHVMEPEPAA